MLQCIVPLLLQIRALESNIGMSINLPARNPAATFTGVWHRDAGSWEAQVNGRHLGTFATIGEASTILEAALMRISPALQAYIDEIHRAAAA